MQIDQLENGCGDGLFMESGPRQIFAACDAHSGRIVMGQTTGTRHMRGKFRTAVVGWQDGTKRITLVFRTQLLDCSVRMIKIDEQAFRLRSTDGGLPLRCKRDARSQLLGGINERYCAVTAVGGKDQHTPAVGVGVMAGRANGGRRTDHPRKTNTACSTKHAVLYPGIETPGLPNGDFYCL